MAELTGVPIPSMDWKASNLPETYRKFKQTCEFIFDGPLEQKNNAIKTQYLMLWVGEEGRDIRESWQLSNAKKNDLAEHWKRFEQYVKPKSNFRVARFQLRALKQESGETVDAFMTRARVLAKECEYTDKDEQLLDTLIAGVNMEEIQRKLISKDKTLTLDQALTIVRGFEATRSQMADIQGMKVQSITRNPRYPSKPTQRRAKPEKPNVPDMPQGKCWNCGGGHSRTSKCPVSNIECNFCHKRGHVERMCITKKKTTASDKMQSQREVHNISNETDNLEMMSQDFEGFVIDSVEIVPNTNVKYVETIYNEGSKDQAFACIMLETKNSGTFSVKCKLDSGAQTNVMPLRVYKQLYPDNLNKNGNPTGLNNTSIQLSAYGGSPIKQFGTFSVKSSHKNKQRYITFHVTDTGGLTMLGLNSCMDLGFLNLNCENKSDCSQCHKKCDISAIESVPNAKSRHVFGNTTQSPKEDMIAQFPDCFKGVGLFPGVYHIDLKPNAEPVIQPPRRVPESLKVPLQRELKRMVDLDIIEPVDGPTDWVNSLVYITKPNGDLRICLDPCDLNKSIRREHHYTPTLDDILPQLNGAKVFSILDARSGYWNVQLDRESQLLTTFNSPYGRFCFKRLPFGLVSAQDIFQKKIDQTFDSITGVIGIADDIVVFGTNEAEHDQNLYSMLERTRQVGLRLNPEKCVIKERKIKFFGNYLTDAGLQPDPDKIKAILEMESPTSVAELQSVLGCANYLGRFTPNLAMITAPLRDLTKKDVDYTWGPEHQQAFQDMKKDLSSSKVLAYFNPSKPVTLQTDASKRGLGAALLQEGRPVAFASKSLSETESNYCNIEREMLAVVFGLERFHHYVYGREVEIESDHKPLESISKKSLSSAPPRLMRMLLRIQKYDFKLKYVPGKMIPVADALSRLPIPGQEIREMDVHVHEITNVTPSRLQQIRDETKVDPILVKLANMVMSGWPKLRGDCPEELHHYWNYRDEIGIIDGILLKSDRVVIPTKMQSEILDRIHTGHQGIDKCRLRAKECVFWSGLSADIDKIVKECAACQHNQSSQQREPMIHIEALQPWEIVGSDLFSWNNSTYLLLVDYHSSFHILRKLHSTTASSVINNIKAIFSEYGVPGTMVTDNGPQYDSQDFKTFAQVYGFRHITSSPHFPQANGKVERYVGVIKNTLQKTHERGDDVSLALLCLRTTPQAGGLSSPANMMFGNRKVKSNLPSIQILEKDEEVLSKMESKQQLHQARYDAHSRPLPELQPGQSVRIQHPISKKWDPAIMRRQCEENPRSYIVETETGGQYRRNRKHIRSTGETFSFTPKRNTDLTAHDTVATGTQGVHSSENENPQATTSHQNDQTSQLADRYVTHYGRTVKAPKKLDL